MSKIAKEGTLLKISDSLTKIVAGLTGDGIDIKKFEDVARVVAGGKQATVFDTGDQLTTTWTDSNGTKYSNPFDIVEVECTPELKNGQVVHGMMLNQHYANIHGCPFDAQEALYDADEELPAGTYHFTIAGDTWTTSENGKVVQFTLTKPIPAGGQLVYADAEGFNKAIAGQKIATYAGPAVFTAIETVSLSEGSEGTDLGSTDGKEKLNHHQRAFRGCGRWMTSMLRQYLNSDKPAGEWWSKQDKWDRASTFVNSCPGYMSGFSADFLSVLRKVKVCTARDTVVNDGGTDVTYDYFFPVSLEQFNAVPQVFDIEGKACHYWKELASGTSKLDTSGKFKQNETYPILRVYALNAKNSPRICWLRSTYRGSANYAWSVYSDGNVCNSSALLGYSCAPACVIVAPQPSAPNTLGDENGTQEKPVVYEQGENEACVGTDNFDLDIEKEE